MIHYPSGDHDLLAQQLGIPDNGFILDVGGGANPFKFATVVVDKDFGEGNLHRDGSTAPLNNKNIAYVTADIQHLPFVDNAFDFVICMHVLEHVDSPSEACEELMRVAKRGFIETPRKWTEFYAGHPTHQWLIDEKNGTLYFEPIAYTDSPFMNFALPSLWDSNALKNKLLKEFSNIPCVQLAWNDRINYHVSGSLPEKVHSPAFMAERHYRFALNLLHWMGPFETGAFHAKAAVELMPESTHCRNLYVFYTILTGKFKDIKDIKPGFKLLLRALTCRLFRNIYMKVLTCHRHIITFI